MNIYIYYINLVEGIRYTIGTSIAGASTRESPSRRETENARGGESSEIWENYGDQTLTSQIFLLYFVYFRFVCWIYDVP